MKIDDSTFVQNRAMFLGKKWVKICLEIRTFKSFFCFSRFLSRSNKTGNPGQLWRNAKRS